MTIRKWTAVSAAALMSTWFASPALAQADPRKCMLPIVSSEERIAVCTQIIEAAKGPKTSLAWAYRNRAHEYFRNREFDRAIADYSQVIQLYPDDRYAYIGRASANCFKRSLDEAIADYDRAIDLDQSDGLAYVGRAGAFVQKDDFEHAFSDYARALELNPSDVRAYLSRGSAYRTKGDIDRAIADFDRAIQISPTYKYAYFQRGGAYVEKGDFDHALADYDEGVRLDPKDARGYRSRAMVKLRAGSLAQSLDDLDQSLEFDPKDAYAALWRDIVARRDNRPRRLAERVAQLDMAKWPAPVVHLFLGETTPEAVLAAAENSDSWLQKGQICEANFYTGELALQQGSIEDAARLFSLAASDCPKGFIERSAAKDELKSLGANP
ncbi:MAG TPA: tetratricopeptide repeat protein [Bradyrhizobium sp.]|nr:tetratricopeptide repeat protein [Bradyrhizobium sp.]